MAQQPAVVVARRRGSLAGARPRWRPAPRRRSSPVRSMCASASTSVIRCRCASVMPGITTCSSPEPPAASSTGPRTLQIALRPNAEHPTATRWRSPTASPSPRRRARVATRPTMIRSARLVASAGTCPMSVSETRSIKASGQAERQRDARLRAVERDKIAPARLPRRRRRRETRRSARPCRWRNASSARSSSVGQQLRRRGEQVRMRVAGPGRGDDQAARMQWREAADQRAVHAGDGSR